MKHATEDELIMAYYQEAPDDIEEHLNSCTACQEELEALRQLLDRVRREDAVVRSEAEVDAAYGNRVWQRIESRLETRPTSGRVSRPNPSVRRFGWLAATLALVLGAYWLGRQDVAPVEIRAEERVQPRPTEGPEAGLVERSEADAILRVALVKHLEGSGLLVREVHNASAAGATDRLPKRAERLLATNRLLRLAARRQDPALDDTLQELERWLTDVAHLDGTSAAFAAVRSRMERRTLLLEINLHLKQLGGALPAKPTVRSPEGEAHVQSV